MGYKEINNKNNKRKKIQGGDILRLLRKNKLEDRWPKIDVNEEQHLPYWNIVNKGVKVVVVHQTVSISLPIYHQRGLYF